MYRAGWLDMPAAMLSGAEGVEPALFSQLSRTTFSRTISYNAAHSPDMFVTNIPSLRILCYSVRCISRIEPNVLEPFLCQLVAY